MSKWLGEFTMGTMHPEFENPLRLDDTPLFEVVFQRIQKSPEHSIPFSEYMDVALYEGNHGYYAHPERRIVGRKGDFFTSVSVGGMFGFLLAQKIAAVRDSQFNSAEPFTVVEQGAHDGQLALDILEGLRKLGITDIEYRIVDPRPETRRWLENRFNEAGFRDSVKIVESLDEAKAGQGIFLSNELLDAFPFRRLKFDKGEWLELQVGRVGDLPVWVSRPLAPELQRYADELGRDFDDGYTTEVCPAVDSWMREAATLFDKGFWWLIDYGYESGDYFAPHRKDGTFRCYRNHQATEDPFRFPGETDITAHVNFTHVRSAAEEAGLKWYQFSDQHHFLIEAARDWLLSIEGQTSNLETEKRLRQFQTLTHPGMMGTQFKMAELSRGMA
ncbi:MAG: SAM-dependent methyltransferase [Verrucomicrobiales bacterium]|nr:SAM-dependent methyltransferase [Verrucomicrobiales bacterium]